MHRADTPYTPQHAAEQASAARSMPFARSQSQAQAFHARQAAPTTDNSQSMHFASSRSEPQAVVKAERHGALWRLKNAFLNSENAISTWMTLGFIKAWTDKTMGAWGVSSPLGKLGTHLPSLPGQEKFTALAYGKDFDKSKLSSAGNRKPEGFFEKTMAVSITGALIQNLAFFMTARGGEIPDGETMGARVKNSLLHPDKHSVHFSSATMTGFIGLIGISRAAIGLKGLKSGDPEAAKKNTMMLVSGLSALVSAPLIFTGIFRIDKNAKPAVDPQEEAAQRQQKDEAAFDHSKTGKTKAKGMMESLKPSHLKDMWQYAFQHDKIGLLGRSLAVAMELGFMLDGRMQLQKDPTSASAHKTVQGGLTGLVLTCMQTHFVYDRLLTNAQKDKGASR